MARDKRLLTVEVAYAFPETQFLLALTVAPGTTVRQAIEQSGIRSLHPEIDPSRAAAGIFGRVAGLDTVLKDGDRVEIYRDLIADPKNRRRARARKKPGR